MLSTILAFLTFLSTSMFADSAYQMAVGSYTANGNAGVEIYEVDPATGASKKLYALDNPNGSYLATTKDRSLLYAVTEAGSGKSRISAYRLGASGRYEKLNDESTIGDGPCFVTIRESSQTVYAANYSSGSLSVFKTNNGSLLPIAQHIKYQGSSVNKARQDKPHAHMARLSPDQKFLYVTDLGTDKIYQHRILADGTVDEKYTAIPVTAGNGPRHMVFNDAGTKAYLINEMKGSVDVFSIADGKFTQVQTVVADTTSSSKDRGSADIHLSPSGKWLISSNRVTNNDLTVFAVQKDGTIRKTGHQPVARTPRNFSFTPNGKFVFVGSQNDHKIQVFAFDEQTGKLTDTKQDITVPMPVCIDFRTMPSTEVNPEERLKTLNIKLIKPSSPIANYVKVVESGKLLFLSGHGPDKPEGGLITGKVGVDLTAEQGKEAARTTAISLLSTLKAYVGDLNRVKRIVKIMGLVNCDPSFTQQPMVMNGCSDLMVDVFGDNGKHVRTSVGTNALPNNIAVEIEMIVELK
jgi:6-phosphogluconolactonase (cycloisomerase 2 family)/enamine deaminase RidA (YjgF/YER057c/UK114 family)